MNVLRGTDKQTTPHHRFLFHTHYQDTILLHIHRTYLPLSFMPWGVLNSLDFLLLKYPLKSTVQNAAMSQNCLEFLTAMFHSQNLQMKTQKTRLGMQREYSSPHQMLVTTHCFFQSNEAFICTESGPPSSISVGLHGGVKSMSNPL